MHRDTLKKKSEFSLLLSRLKKIESRAKVPFHVLCHGDFNIDNVIFEEGTYRPVFVDLHRSRFQDYVQDVSVFVVSNYRVPIFSHDVRHRLNLASLEMLHFARNFAQSKGDQDFEIRLALGLIRSFATSTRFQLSEDFSERMFNRSLEIMRHLCSKSRKLSSFEVLDKWVIMEVPP